MQLLSDRLQTTQARMFIHDMYLRFAQTAVLRHLRDEDAFAVVLHGSQQVEVRPHLVVVLERRQNEAEVLNVRNRLVFQTLK